ncbi:MAG: biotin/lipoyl-containing protein [Christensenella sp.]
MDLKSVLELLKAVDDTGWSKFEMSENDFSLKLERNNGAEAQQIFVATPQPPQAAAPVAAPVEAPLAENKGKEIVSPLVGIFHMLSDGKSVKIGDRLKKGDVLCMVEAMKLMNEITMPEDGEITWAACEDGDSVEYGQLLYNYI